MPETATVRDYRTHVEREVAERFPRDVADHNLTVLRDDGLYRHLKCGNPTSPFYWFEIVTWPGSLAIRGDMGGGWIFSRIDDMFQFFRSHRSHGGRINPGYWAEKLPDAGRSVRVHSERVLHDRLEPELVRYEEEVERQRAEYEKAKAAYEAAPAAERLRMNRPAEPRPVDARSLIADYEADDMLRFADSARELLGGLERAGVVEGAWEWDLTDWDWPFLWACHGIVWAIGEYDRSRAAAGAGTGNPGLEDQPPPTPGQTGGEHG